ncbi:YadA-like family protein [Veillonella ratti]|uniref:YadA-like family protein n=1 Tax=Veillonella ratti TaxID=103892 RepID=UPI000F8F56C7|nr:YadA-like family protein [Veillonella ratti]
MKNKVKRNLILALTIGGIATIPNFVFANTAVNTPGTVTDLVNGVAIGSNSDSKGTGISIGANAKTEQPIGAIAIGNNADAVTSQSIAIGDGAIAGKKDMDNPQDPNNRTTVGKRSNIAIGTGAVAEGGRNISIGENTGNGTIDNWNINNVNIGTEASQNSKKDYSVAIGYRAGSIKSDEAKIAQAGVADGNRAPSVYIGKEAGTDTAAYGNIGIGNGAGKGIIDTRTASSIMIGNGAGVGMTSNDGKNLTFPGFGSGSNILVGNASGRNISGDGNVALGNIAGEGSKGDNNIYFGHLAGQNSTNDRSIIMGPQSGSNSTNDRAVLIGNFANGNVTQATRNVVGIGSSVQSTGYESTAIGFNAKAQANNTNVIGRFAIATAVNAIAIGTNTNASGVSSIALGDGAKVSGKNSISIGTGNIVSGEDSAAIGNSSNISGTASYSVGNNNTISTNDTFVLGSNVTKTADNSVFLGKDAAYVADSATTKGLANDYISEIIEGLTYNYAGGTQNIGVVSVGNVNGTRRIQNVAPALISATSTDAVNGSQLYDTNKALGNVANSVAKLIGGSYTINPNGTITTQLNYNGNTYESVQDLVNNIKSGSSIVVNGGTNVTVDNSTTTDNKGNTTSTTYTVNAASVTSEPNSGINVSPIKNTDDKVINYDISLSDQIKNQIAKEESVKAGSSNLVVSDATTNTTGGKEYTVDIAKDLNLTSVTTSDGKGNTTITNANGIKMSGVDGKTVNLSSTGLDNGGNRITNVGPGLTATDAVNYGQLTDLGRDLNGKINNLANEIGDASAQNAALAALKPIQYDPLEPTQIMAGYGYYNGSSAIALGVAHYKNESLMFHTGVSMTGGSSKVMANAGVTWKIGYRADETAIRDTYRQGPISSIYNLQDRIDSLVVENKYQKQHIKNQDNRIKELESKLDDLLVKVNK